MAVLNTSDFVFGITLMKRLLDIDGVCRDSILVNVSYNNHYSGEVQFYCRHDVCKKFVSDISILYNTLRKGRAKISEEFEEDDNFVLFESDGTGHFTISGILNDWDMSWSLKFEEYVDQTFFAGFIKQLNDELK